MTGPSPKHAPIPPDWISKPLRAMIPDELEDLRAALCRETPPDAALLRAVDGQLARHAAWNTGHQTTRYATPSDVDDESEDWAWAVDG